MRIQSNSLILLMSIFLLASCNKENKPTDSAAQADSSKVSESSAPQSDASTETSANLLQGKWQSTDDKTNFLVFEGTLRKETAGGTDKWDEEPFVLSDHCENDLNLKDEIKPEKDRYISCKQSDLCWYILKVDKETLSLSYMGRGNTLNYQRAK